MNRKGFTLIELIVVIAILAILAAVAMPSFFGLLERSKQTVLISDVSVMESIIITYQLLRDEPPDTNPQNPGGKTDLQWNEYAREHLNDYIVGGWPVSTPFGGFYTYRAYPEEWALRHNWQSVFGSGNITEITGDDAFEIIMIRFVNPEDESGYNRTIEALENSPFRDRVFRYSNEFNIGILVKSR